ncbi:T9SS type A sorting domain-containing protein, partial [Marinirhabdus gelatinilytica]
TDLTQGDYTFRSNKANQDRRFTVLFERDPQLGVGSSDLKGISIHPNPTDGILNIVSEKSNIKEISVYGILGQKLYDIKNSTRNFQLDLSNLDSAIYFVNITTEDGSITKRVIKI